MIVACPACATRYELDNAGPGVDGEVIRCSACGHSWLEASAIEVIDINPASTAGLPVSHESRMLEFEAERLAMAARKSEELRRKRAAEQRAKRRGWGLLAAAICLPVAGAIAAPNTVVQYAPGAYALYRAAGIEINTRGFEIRDVSHQHIMADKTRVLAVRGQVVNITGRDSKVPALRFVLRDKSGKVVFAWTLNGVSAKPLKAGESTSFVTRVAAPPETADDIEIRFARKDEIGSNAGS